MHKYRELSGVCWMYTERYRIRLLWNVWTGITIAIIVDAEIIMILFSWKLSGPQPHNEWASLQFLLGNKVISCGDNGSHRHKCQFASCENWYCYFYFLDGVSVCFKFSSRVHGSHEIYEECDPYLCSSGVRKFVASLVADGFPPDTQIECTWDSVSSLPTPISGRSRK